MGANEEILRRNQAGLEVTRGTGVAATRLVYANITPNFEKPLREFSDTSGTFAARRRKAFQRERATFSLTDLATFEDLAWWMQLGMKGGVAGAGDGGTPIAYTYAFVPSLSTDDIKSMTLEFNHTGNVYKSKQVMLNSWTVRIDPDNEGGWMLDGELLALDMLPSTYTAALTDRTTEVISAPGTKLFLDDATLGSTQKTDSFISASISANQNIHFKAFGEHKKNFAPNKVGRGQRTFNGQVVLEFDSDTEFEKFRSETYRYMRLESEGTQIHGSSVVNKRARIDTNGYWETISWGNREGNIIATFGISAFYDAVSGYDLKMEVVNGLLALP